MSLARLASLTLLALAGFALADSAARAQDLPKKNNEAFRVINDLRDMPGGMPKEKIPEAQKAFASFAKYYTELLAHPAIHKAPTEFKDLKLPDGTRPPTIDGDGGILREMDRYLLYPSPGARNIGARQADYIREFGAVIDAAFKEQIENAPDAIVRINTARAYAHLCRSGAAAHFPTVTAMLTNANVRPEIKNYALQAAGSLLAAYDPTELRTRRHAGDLKTVGALVAALQDSIANPALLVPGLPGNKLDEKTPADQFLVVAYMRRQAVKALGQCRFAVVAGPDGKAPIYPAHTLCRVALGDPALFFPPSPGESADAALGLLNMAPVRILPDGRAEAVKGYSPEVVLEALTTALITFASPRAARAEDRTLPWSNYATKLAEGLQGYSKLYDPDFDPTAPNKADTRLAPAALDEFRKEVTARVLAPIDKATLAGRVEIELLRKRLQDIRNNPKRKTELVAGVAATSVAFPPPKAP